MAAWYLEDDFKRQILVLSFRSNVNKGRFSKLGHQKKPIKVSDQSAQTSRTCCMFKRYCELFVKV